MTTPAPTARCFGRCPLTGCATRIVADSSHEGVTIDDSGVPLFDVETLTRDAYSSVGVTLVKGIAFCTEHRWPIKWRGVKGILSAMECDSRCWTGTGADCKCSCEGANHGSQAG